MHADRDSQHGSHADQICADMTIAQRAVICAPICHHSVNIAERALPGNVGRKPVCGPGGIGAFIQLFDELSQAGQLSSLRQFAGLGQFP